MVAKVCFSKTMFLKIVGNKYKEMEMELFGFASYKKMEYFKKKRGLSFYVIVPLWEMMTTCAVSNICLLAFIAVLQPRF